MQAANLIVIYIDDYAAHVLHSPSDWQFNKLYSTVFEYMSN